MVPTLLLDELLLIVPTLLLDELLLIVPTLLLDTSVLRLKLPLSVCVSLVVDWRSIPVVVLRSIPVD
jgi:hypothetical protein